MTADQQHAWMVLMTLREDIQNATLATIGTSLPSHRLVSKQPNIMKVSLIRANANLRGKDFLLALLLTSDTKGVRNPVAVRRVLVGPIRGLLSQEYQIL